MIAACPKCQTRYRLRLEQIGERGVRLRCRRCEALFRVLPPSADPVEQDLAGQAPALSTNAPVSPAAQDAASAAPPQQGPSSVPAAPTEPPSAPALLVAHRDAREAKRIADVFCADGQPAIASDDGVQTLLSIHRAPPRIVVLDTALRGVDGHQICEVMKRNPALCEIPVVILHDPGEDVQSSGADGWGADLYVDRGYEERVPEQALLEPLRAWGLRVPEPVSAPLSADPPPPSPALPDPEPAVTPAAATPPAVTERAAAPESEPTEPALAEELARAERLARIAVSDIILYNEEKFAAALQSSDPLKTMRDEIEEGRSLLRGRIAEEVFAQRDFVGDELLRVARERA